MLPNTVENDAEANFYIRHANMNFLRLQDTEVGMVQMN